MEEHQPLGESIQGQYRPLGKARMGGRILEDPSDRPCCLDPRCSNGPADTRIALVCLCMMEWAKYRTLISHSMPETAIPGMALHHVTGGFDLSSSLLLMCTYAPASTLDPNAPRGDESIAPTAASIGASRVKSQGAKRVAILQSCPVEHLC